MKVLHIKNKDNVKNASEYSKKNKIVKKVLPNIYLTQNTKTKVERYSVDVIVKGKRIVLYGLTSLGLAIKMKAKIIEEANKDSEMKEEAL